MVKQASVLSQLQSIVGSESLSEDTSAFTVDGLAPQAVVAPSTYELVAEVMRYAHSEGLAVIPHGAGAHRRIGNLPVRYDIALSLTRLNAIIEHEPADMTVTCQAGTTVAKLSARLRQSGQLVPLSADSADQSTVGGLLAANYSSLRLPYGAPRDFTIGMRVITADGRITKAGGRVVKNVAGYDLCKLYIGSLGTLGVIVETTFKLAPLPQARDSSALQFQSVQSACQFAAELRRRGLSLWAVAIRRLTSPDDDRLMLSVDLAGGAAAVERSRGEVDQLARQRGATPFAASSPPKAERTSAHDQLTCVASVLPTRVPALVAAFDAVDPSSFIDIQPIQGTVEATWLSTAEQKGLVERLRIAASTLDGTLVVTACSPELKRLIDVFPEVPQPTLDLMRRVKEQFDPEDILSPGRFIGKI